MPSSTFDSAILFPITDTVLIALNLFNLIVGIIPKILPPYVTFKKTVIQFQYKVVKKAHSKPFVKQAVTVSLWVLTLFLAFEAKKQNTGDGGGDTMMMPTLCRAIVAGYTLLCTILLQSLSETLLVIGADRMMDIEQEVDHAHMVKFEPLPKAVIKAAMAPQNAILKSEFHGLENVPTNTPALYVMNHSLMGVEMGPFVANLYQEKGVWVRGLADHFHFTSPHGEFLRNMCGAVDGTRANVDCLMENRENVLVYPGGGMEILKHSSVPKYELLWKERLGFARMAIKHGYPILPCAAVGTEDMLDIMADLPAGFIKKGQTIPVVSTSPSRMQKMYFWFGEPIPTSQYNGDMSNDDFAREVRDKAKTAVEMGIKLMKERQQNDPDRFLMHEMANKIISAKEDAKNRLTSALTSLLGDSNTSSSSDNNNTEAYKEEKKVEDSDSSPEQKKTN